MNEILQEWIRIEKLITKYEEYGKLLLKELKTKYKHERAEYQSDPCGHDSGYYCPDCRWFRKGNVKL